MVRALCGPLGVAAARIQSRSLVRFHGRDRDHAAGVPALHFSEVLAQPAQVVLELRRQLRASAANLVDQRILGA